MRALLLLLTIFLGVNGCVEYTRVGDGHQGSALLSGPTVESCNLIVYTNRIKAALWITVTEVSCVGDEAIGQVFDGNDASATSLLSGCSAGLHGASFRATNGILFIKKRRSSSVLRIQYYSCGGAVFVKSTVPQVFQAAKKPFGGVADLNCTWRLIAQENLFTSKVILKLKNITSPGAVDDDCGRSTVKLEDYVQEKEIASFCAGHIVEKIWMNRQFELVLRGSGTIDVEAEIYLFVCGSTITFAESLNFIPLSEPLPINFDCKWHFKLTKRGDLECSVQRLRLPDSGGVMTVTTEHLSKIFRGTVTNDSYWKNDKTFDLQLKSSKHSVQLNPLIFECRLSKCDGVIDVSKSSSGVLNSPNFPSLSTAAYCSWTLKNPPTNSLIRIVITDLIIPKSTSCVDAALVIKRLGASTPEVLASLCEKTDGVDYFYTGDGLEVTFRSIVSPLSISFRIEYDVLPACSGAYFLRDTQSVTLSSPNFPSNYPPDTFCDWHVSCDSRRNSILHCLAQTLQMDATSSCADKVLRLDGKKKNEDTRKTMCKLSDWPSTYHLSILRLKFETNSDAVTGPGVRVICIACGGEIFVRKDTPVVVKTPTFPGSSHYPNGVNCLWNLKTDTSRSQRLLIYLNASDLADAAKCDDYVTIADKMPTHKSLVKLCGKRDAGDVWSASQLMIHFRANDVNSASGAQFLVTTCGGEYIAGEEENVLYGPTLAAVRNGDVDCVWNLVSRTDSRIVLAIEDRNLGSDCSLNYLRVDDRDPICGKSESPISFFSGTNSMRIKFVSKAGTYSEASKFKLRFASCGGTVAGKGKITAFASESLLSVADCNWKITLGSMTGVLAKVTELETSGTCSDDNILKIDSTRLCRSSAVGRSFFYQKNIEIGYRLQSGAKAAVEFNACGGYVPTTEGTFGYISSPLTPRVDTGPVSCSWTFIREKSRALNAVGALLHLDVVFEGHSNASCAQTGLEVFDVIGGERRLLRTFCAPTVGALSVNADEVIVRYTSNTTTLTTASAFKVYYLNCGGTYKDEASSVTSILSSSLSYVREIPIPVAKFPSSRELKCSWTFSGGVLSRPIELQSDSADLGPNVSLNATEVASGRSAVFPDDGVSHVQFKATGILLVEMTAEKGEFKALKLKIHVHPCDQNLIATSSFQTATYRLAKHGICSWRITNPMSKTMELRVRMVITSVMPLFNCVPYVSSSISDGAHSAVGGKLTYFTQTDKAVVHLNNLGLFFCRLEMTVEYRTVDRPLVPVTPTHTPITTLAPSVEPYYTELTNVTTTPSCGPTVITSTRQCMKNGLDVSNEICRKHHLGLSYEVTILESANNCGFDYGDCGYPDGFDKDEVVENKFTFFADSKLGYVCKCKKRFHTSRHGRSCTLTDECALPENKCWSKGKWRPGVIGCAEDSKIGHRCNCDSQFEYDTNTGQCKPKDICEERPCKDPEATCKVVPSGFQCLCAGAPPKLYSSRRKKCCQIHSFSSKGRTVFEHRGQLPDGGRHIRSTIFALSGMKAALGHSFFSHVYVTSTGVTAFLSLKSNSAARRLRCVNGLYKCFCYSCSAEVAKACTSAEVKELKHYCHDFVSDGCESSLCAMPSVFADIKNLDMSHPSDTEASLDPKWDESTDWSLEGFFTPMAMNFGFSVNSSFTVSHVEHDMDTPQLLNKLLKDNSIPPSFTETFIIRFDKVYEKEKSPLWEQTSFTTIIGTTYRESFAFGLYDDCNAFNPPPSASVVREPIRLGLWTRNGGSGSQGPASGINANVGELHNIDKIHTLVPLFGISGTPAPRLIAFNLTTNVSRQRHPGLACKEWLSENRCRHRTCRIEQMTRIWCPRSSDRIQLGYRKVDFEGLGRNTRCFQPIFNIPGGRDYRPVCCYKVDDSRFPPLESFVFGSMGALADRGLPVNFLFRGFVSERRAEFLAQREAYRACCLDQLPGDQCREFMRHRPFPLNNAFLTPSGFRGDVHLILWDGQPMTFNGVGEFLMAKGTTTDEAVGFSMTALLQTGKMAKKVSFTTAVAMQCRNASNIGTSDLVQFSMDSSRTSIQVFVNGDLLSGVSIGPSRDIALKEAVVRISNSSISAILECGISVAASLAPESLALQSTLQPFYKGRVQGLLGNFNDIPTDDLRSRSGTTVLPSNASDREIFAVASTWIVNCSDPGEALLKLTSAACGDFTQKDFQPLFFDSFEAADVAKARLSCGEDRACQIDLMATKSMELAQGTRDGFARIEKLRESERNQPPKFVDNPPVCRVMAAAVGFCSIAVSDPDAGDSVTLTIKSTSSWITFDPNSRKLRWTKLTLAVFSNLSLTATAVDKRGGVTVRPVQLHLCSCQNGGVCEWPTASTSDLPHTTHLDIPCRCTRGWSGRHCDHDFNGCLGNPCVTSCRDVPAHTEASNSSAGAFTCSPCPRGFEGDGITCRDINECSKRKTHFPFVCRNFPGGYTETCGPGFITVGAKCIDIDECTSGTATCPEGALCKNGPGNYSCECPSGTTQTANACVDRDECDDDVRLCRHRANSYCYNTYGEFECRCYPRFVLNASNHCAPGDLCKPSNPCAQLCTTQDGSLVCSCRPGFRLAADKFSCQPIKNCSTAQEAFCVKGQCAVDNSGAPVCVCGQGSAPSVVAGVTHCTRRNECLSDSEHLCRPLGIARCNDLDTGYYCNCPKGYRLSADDFTCVDIDECSKLITPCDTASSKCRNTNGSYECVCKDGFQKVNGSCQDTDECLQSQKHCPKEHICVNTVGSFFCRCKPGFTSNGDTCVDVNECRYPHPNDCDPIHGNCVNTAGSYRCECRSGFMKSAVSSACIDIDECLRPICKGGTCRNLPGSYQCICPLPLRLHNDGVTCTAPIPSPPLWFDWANLHLKLRLSRELPSAIISTVLVPAVHEAVAAVFSEFCRGRAAFCCGRDSSAFVSSVSGTVLEYLSTDDITSSWPTVPSDFVALTLKLRPRRDNALCSSLVVRRTRRAAVDDEKIVAKVLAALISRDEARLVRRIVDNAQMRLKDAGWNVKVTVTINGDGPPPTPTPTPEPEPDFPWYIILAVLGVVMIIAVGIGIAVYCYKKKKKDNELIHPDEGTHQNDGDNFDCEIYLQTSEIQLQNMFGSKDDLQIEAPPPYSNPTYSETESAQKESHFDGRFSEGVVHTFDEDQQNYSNNFDSALYLRTLEVQRQNLFCNIDGVVHTFDEDQQNYSNNFDSALYLRTSEVQRQNLFCNIDGVVHTFDEDQQNYSNNLDSALYLRTSEVQRQNLFCNIDDSYSHDVSSQAFDSVVYFDGDKRHPTT